MIAGIRRQEGGGWRGWLEPRRDSPKFVKEAVRLSFITVDESTGDRPHIWRSKVLEKHAGVHLDAG